ncbi:MAG: PIG-L family deacetylase [Candidatus Sulfopaludibacter sp.]|nr:PIG-L family deacetylase [Candidatus Sulfopaludibacter sp.]
MGTTRILAIHAHPDDVEILAGGTVALLAGLGHAITIATFTAGDCGSRELGPEEIAAVRGKEAARSAARIGAAYVCLGMRDLAIFNDDPSRRRVVEVLRQTRPQLVLTSSPVDYLCDHEAASALVRDACFAAPAPNYHTGAADPAPPLDAVPHLYWMDPVGGGDREGHPVAPDFVVNVAETFARKREMLSEHASQRVWLRQHHGTDDYLDTMERWTRERGRQAGFPYGEGFRQYRGHPYPQTPLLQELLGGVVGGG